MTDPAQKHNRKLEGRTERLYAIWQARALLSGLAFLGHPSPRALPAIFARHGMELRNAPISASWSFSPAASSSSCEIRAASSLEVSFESTAFLAFPSCPSWRRSQQGAGAGRVS